MVQNLTPQTASFTWHSPEPPAPNPEVRIVFTVPAKDEEDTIAACLEAFQQQIDVSGRFAMASFEVLLLINNTTDGTINRALAARRHPGVHVVSVDLPPHYAHIGWARRLAMEWGSQRLVQNGHPDGIIVSTDADSQLASDFVRELMQTFALPNVHAAGAMLLVKDEIRGSVFDNLRKYFSLEKQLRQRAQQEVAFDLVHSHFSGAGFAVRQRMYAAVGGLSPWPYNEDKYFYQKLLQRDACIKMNDRLIIYTSSRTAGRTEWGMAAQLMKWKKAEEDGEYVFVSSAHSQWLCFQLQKALYAYWLVQSAENLNFVCQYLAEYKLTNPLLFLNKIEKPAYFGQYWYCVWEHPKLVEARQTTFAAIPLEEGIAQLTALLSTLENQYEALASLRA